MAAMKEHIAQYTSSQATQQPQQLPDDPLAPVPIRFTHQRDADGVLRKRTVNGPTVGWHLEDGSEGEDAEPSRHQGQTFTSSRQTRDYLQQAQLNRAYPPDYEDADEPDTRPPRSGICYQHTRPYQYRGRPCCPLPQSTCAASASPGRLPGDGAGTGRCTW